MCTDVLVVVPGAASAHRVLGIAEDYIDRCRALFTRLHRVSPMNAVAYSTGAVTWVHVAHPSPGNGFYGEWLNGDATKSGIARKRELARAVIQTVLALGRANVIAGK